MDLQNLLYSKAANAIYLVGSYRETNKHNPLIEERKRILEELHKQSNHILLYSYKFGKILKITKVQLVVHTRYSEKHKIVRIKGEDTNRTENEKSYCTLTRLLIE